MSDHPKCETCRYWGDDDDYNETVGAKICTKPEMLWNATKWNDDGERVAIDPALKMFVQDASDYMAFLYTKADFYCYHHEPLDVKGEKP